MMRKKMGAVIVAALTLSLAIPAIAFAATYPGSQASYPMTIANGGIASFQSNTYIEPAARRLTAGIVVKCSTHSMPANKAKSSVYLLDRDTSRSLSHSVNKYSQAVSKNQFSYNTTVYSVAAGKTVTGRASGHVVLKDPSGSYSCYMYPGESPIKTSL